MRWPFLLALLLAGCPSKPGPPSSPAPSATPHTDCRTIHFTGGPYGCSPTRTCIRAFGYYWPDGSLLTEAERATCKDEIAARERRDPDLDAGALPARPPPGPAAP